MHSVISLIMEINLEEMFEIINYYGFCYMNGFKCKGNMNLRILRS